MSFFMELIFSVFRSLCGQSTFVSSILLVLLIQYSLFLMEKKKDCCYILNGINDRKHCIMESFS